MTDTSSGKSGEIQEPKKSLFDICDKLNITIQLLLQTSVEVLVEGVCKKLLERSPDETGNIGIHYVLNKHLSPLWAKYARRCGEMEDRDDGDQRFLSLVKLLLDKPDVLNFVLLRIAPWAGAFGVERAEKLLDRPLREEIWQLRETYFNIQNHEEFISAMKQLDLEFYFIQGKKVLAAHFLEYIRDPQETLKLYKEEIESVRSFKCYPEDVPSDLEFIAKLGHNDAPEIIFSLFNYELYQRFWSKDIAEVLGEYFAVFVREQMESEILNDGPDRTKYLPAYHHVVSEEVIKHLVDDQLKGRPSRDRTKALRYRLDEVLDILIHHQKQDGCGKALETINKEIYPAIDVLNSLAKEKCEEVLRLASLWLRSQKEESPLLSRQFLQIIQVTNSTHDLEVNWLKYRLKWFEEEIWYETIIHLIGKCKNQDEAAKVLSNELRNHDASRNKAALKAIVNNGIVSCYNTVEKYLAKVPEHEKDVKLFTLLLNGNATSHKCFSKKLNIVSACWKQDSLPQQMRWDLLHTLVRSQPEGVEHFLKSIHESLHNVEFVESPIIADLIFKANAKFLFSWLRNTYELLNSYLIIQNQHLHTNPPDIDSEVNYDSPHEIFHKCKSAISKALVLIDPQWAILNMDDDGELKLELARKSFDNSVLYYTDDTLTKAGQSEEYNSPEELQTDIETQEVSVGDITIKYETNDSVDYILHIYGGDQKIDTITISKIHTGTRSTHYWRLLDLMLISYPGGPSFPDIVKAVYPDYEKYLELFSPENDDASDAKSRVFAEIQGELKPAKSIPQFSNLDYKIGKSEPLFHVLKKANTLVGDLRKKKFPPYLHPSFIKAPGSHNTPRDWIKPFTRFACKIEKL